MAAFLGPFRPSLFSVLTFNMLTVFSAFHCFHCFQGGCNNELVVYIHVAVKVLTARLAKAREP